MAAYECVRVCQFKGRLWQLGEVYEGEDHPPRHFSPLGGVIADARAPDRPGLTAESPDVLAQPGPVKVVQEAKPAAPAVQPHKRGRPRK